LTAALRANLKRRKAPDNKPEKSDAPPAAADHENAQPDGSEDT